MCRGRDSTHTTAHHSSDIASDQPADQPADEPTDEPADETADETAADGNAIDVRDGVEHLAVDAAVGVPVEVVGVVVLPGLLLRLPPQGPARRTWYQVKAQDRYQPMIRRPSSTAGLSFSGKLASVNQSMSLVSTSSWNSWTSLASSR